MRVTVVRPRELGSGEAELWRTFQRSVPGLRSPYMSLTFARVIDRFRTGARVAVIEDQGRIQAFLPFEHGARGMAVPIGYPLNNLHGLIGSGSPVDVRRVVRKSGLRAWRFTCVPAGQSDLTPFHHLGTVVRSPVIDLTADYRSVLSARRKSRSALERQLGTVSLDWSCDQPGLLGKLMDWKSEKYQDAETLLRDPTARPIIECLAAMSEPDCNGVVSVLFAGGQPTAIHLGLLSHGILAGWFMAYDSGLSKYAPGMVMWLPLAQAAESHGVSQIDLGFSQNAYKLELANGGYPVAAGTVWVSRAEALARQGYRRLLDHRNEHASPGRRSGSAGAIAAAPHAKL